MFLLQKALDVAHQAKQKGILSPIDTNSTILEQEGIQFTVKVAADWQRRKQKSHANVEKPNPFLPYETSLFVDDITTDHVCILNKFPVLQPHLLLITRHFEAQDALLTQANFNAAYQLMQRLDGNGVLFYNAGPAAGASQAHRHLQWIPHAFTDNGFDPCRHANLLAVDQYLSPIIDSQPQSLYQLYRKGLQQLGWTPSRAYNLLITKQWMWLIPRHSADWQRISLNSLAFIGSFFAKDRDEADVLATFGCVTALRSVVGWGVK